MERKKKQSFFDILKKLSAGNIVVGLVAAFIVLVLYLFTLGLLSVPFLNLISLRMKTVTFFDILFTIVISVLAGIAAMLFSYISRKKTCGLGVASSGSGVFLGLLTVVCPVCNLFLFSLLGASFTLSFLSPFIFELRIISIVLLSVSVYWMYKKVW